MKRGAVKRSANRAATAKAPRSRITWHPVLARRPGFRRLSVYVKPSDKAKGHTRLIEHPWNPALRYAMFGRSGVYAIRSSRTRAVLYVGESHTGHAWRTFKRHFQGIDSGLFENMAEHVNARPGQCEAAFLPSRVGMPTLILERDTILALRPKHNRTVPELTSRETAGADDFEDRF